VERPADPGTIDVAGYVAASLGPPRWLERLQDIEAEELRIVGELRRAWLALAGAADATPARFADAWRNEASAVELAELNLLIAQHNEYFPIERNLPFDLRTRDYRAPWGIAWRRQPRDGAWVLERLPADLGVARAALAAARDGSAGHG
jgi:hypothetical protein